MQFLQFCRTKTSLYCLVFRILHSDRKLERYFWWIQELAYNSTNAAANKDVLLSKK